MVTQFVEPTFIFMEPQHQETSGTVVIGETQLQIEDVVRVARYGAKVRLTDDPAVLERVHAAQTYIKNAVADNKPIYGVTSGFGGMADVVISAEDASELQTNLVWFMNSGAGNKIPLADVRATMLVRANSHLHGASGLRLELIRRLETFLNANVTPYVFEFSSIGASGDLAPLAQITGALIGLDRCFKVDYDGEAQSAPERIFWSKSYQAPIALGPTSRVALLTQWPCSTFSFNGMGLNQMRMASSSYLSVSSVCELAPSVSIVFVAK